MSSPGLWASINRQASCIWQVTSEVKDSLQKVELRPYEAFLDDVREHVKAGQYLWADSSKVCTRIPYQLHHQELPALYMCRGCTCCVVKLTAIMFASCL